MLLGGLIAAGSAIAGTVGTIIGSSLGIAGSFGAISGTFVFGPIGAAVGGLTAALIGLLAL